MRILFPFDLMNHERWDRYRPQIMPIANNVDEVIIYSEFGSDIRDIKNISFHYVENVDIPAKKGRFGNIIPLKIVMRILREKRYARLSDIFDVDLIYGLSTSGYLQYAYLEMKKVHGVPIVYRMRGYGVRERKFTQTFPLREINNMFDLYSTRTFDYYIPINMEYVRILYNRGVDSGRISEPIINGVNTKLFRPVSYPKRFTIGYAGRISKEKGIDFLIELMRKTSQSYIVVGKKMMDFVAPKNCSHWGLLPHYEMNNFYNNCSIIVLPSYSEGVSNVILESYASGRPIIASEKVIPKEIPLYGYKLPHNIDEWKDLIGTLDADTMKNIGLDARKWAEKQSWDEYGKKMVDIFRKVVRK